MIIHDKFTVLGEPKAQKRHRSTKVGGFIRQYDPSSADKGDFLSIVQQNAPETPYTVPLHLEMDFYFSRPKSHFKSGKNSHIKKENAPSWHTTKPDIDNCIKFVMDALNKVFWTDDKLVCRVSISKRYSDKPRTEISISNV